MKKKTSKTRPTNAEWRFEDINGQKHQIFYLYFPGGYSMKHSVRETEWGYKTASIAPSIGSIVAGMLGEKLSEVQIDDLEKEIRSLEGAYEIIERIEGGDGEYHNELLVPVKPASEIGMSPLTPGKYIEYFNKDIKLISSKYGNFVYEKGVKLDIRPSLHLKIQKI
jgi:hypothetical protein